MAVLLIGSLYSFPWGKPRPRIEDVRYGASLSLAILFVVTLYNLWSERGVATITRGLEVRLGRWFERCFLRLLGSTAHQKRDHDTLFQQFGERLPNSVVDNVTHENEILSACNRCKNAANERMRPTWLPGPRFGRVRLMSELPGGSASVHPPRMKENFRVRFQGDKGVERPHCHAKTSSDHNDHCSRS